MIHSRYDSLPFVCRNRTQRRIRTDKDSYVLRLFVVGVVSLCQGGGAKLKNGEAAVEIKMREYSLLDCKTFGKLRDRISSE